ncbi:Transmembrane channel-like protein 5 [Nibea albiflora]|uniref:Transmembrane channel-like protein 5 n=1 Tax=Nibea albiflora TaxID=240163 RepID=A0ACB7FPN9_NIBAL|nr:Transmembrane channel-like protein 5 [Nibea albiflora]
MHYLSPDQTGADNAVGRVPWGGWQEESWRGRESIPMGLISTRPGSPSWQHDHSNMTMRWRGITMRRMSMFPNSDPAHLAFTEDAIRNEMENEEQNLVKELVALSTRDRIRAIRDLAMSFEEKKHIRSQVLTFKSAKQSRQFTCFADCSERMSLPFSQSFRRCGYSVSSARQTLELWQGIMKEIGGTFGTSVLSYFVFLKWLLMFNIFSFLVNFGFITIPVLVYDPSPNIPLNVSFRGLEILTGAESLSERAQGELLTLSEKLKHFGIHLGFWFLSTSLAVGCGVGIYYLCIYEKKHTTDAANWSLLQEAQTLLVPFVVSLMNLVVPLFYSLFNKFEHYSSQRQQIYALVLRNVFLRMSILGVLCYYWMNVVAEKFSCWESMVGQALYRLVIFDFFFLMLGSFFGEFLRNVMGRRLLPRLGVPEFDVARNVLELIYTQTLAWIGIYFSPLLPAIQILKFFILFYLKKVSLTQNCQPPRRQGRAAQMQTIFIALLFFPFFVGALSIVAYTSWSLTPSEQCGPFRGLNNTFSVVEVWIDKLEMIPGSQWVIWIFQNVIRSEIFYFFITLIIIVIIYIFWQVTQGRKQLIVQLRQQIINEGRDKTFLLEKLQNLQKSNKKSKQRNHKKHASRRSDDHSSGGQSNSNAMVQALLARQRIEDEEERHRAGGVPVPSDISNSSALAQAMLARQRAEDQDEDSYQMSDRHSSSSFGLTYAMQARQVAERDENYGIVSVMMQVMQARQRAEELPQNPAPAGSSALIQAMLARQQAQNEYDDGY